MNNSPCLVLNIVEDFVDSLICSSAEVSRYRGSKKLEPKDVRFVLERRFNATLPPDSSIKQAASGTSTIHVAKSPSGAKKA